MAFEPDAAMQKFAFLWLQNIVDN